MSIDIPIRPEDFNPGSRNVSNSEVTAYLSCKRQYDFAFMDNLAPAELAVPLDRGTVGHLAFEYYITARLKGLNEDECLKAGRLAFSEAIERTPERISMYMETQQIWERYMDFHQGWPNWELLGTEQRVDLELTDTLKIAIRYDLKVRDRQTGKILIGDWKFAYDFWSDDDHYLNGQMPKYIAVLRLNGFTCDGGFIEQVRTRPLTSAKMLSDHRNLWRRNYYWPSARKLKSVMRQHIAAALEIEKHRELDLETRRNIVSLPVLNKFGACKYCNFKSLCNSLNEGVEDLSVEIRVNYTQNTYGYNEGQSVPGLPAAETTELGELL